MRVTFIAAPLMMISQSAEIRGGSSQHAHCPWQHRVLLLLLLFPYSVQMMMQPMMEMQQNPGAAMNCMSDPEVGPVLMKIAGMAAGSGMGAGAPGMGGMGSGMGGMGGQQGNAAPANSYSMRRRWTDEGSLVTDGKRRMRKVHHHQRYTVHWLCYLCSA